MPSQDEMLFLKCRNGVLSHSVVETLFFKDGGGFVQARRKRGITKGGLYAYRTPWSC